MSKIRRPSWEKQFRAMEQRWVKECAARLEVEKREKALAEAIEEHRDTLDKEALGPRRRDRDQVDNDLYNVLHRMYASWRSMGRRRRESGRVGSSVDG